MTEQEAWAAYCARRDAPEPVPPTDAERWTQLWALVDEMRAGHGTDCDEWNEGFDWAAQEYADQLELLLPPRSTP